MEGKEARRPQRYSVVPNRWGEAHYVYDKTIRRGYYYGTIRRTGLRALCGTPVVPSTELEAVTRCEACVAALQPGDQPRPDPGNPLLYHMAALYPQDSQ